MLLLLAALLLAGFAAFRWLRVQRVAGPLTGTVTWHGEVRLTGDVTIPTGATLVVEPDTCVEATADVALLVDGGELRAVGTTEQPIRFTSAARRPAAGDWAGLAVLAGTATLEHVQIEHAKVGLHALQPLSVADCTFADNAEAGLSAELPAAAEIDSLDALPELAFRGCSFRHNQGVGARLVGPAVRLDDCVAEGNGGEGVTLLCDRGRVEVDGLTARRNGGLGLLSEGNPRRLQVLNSAFEANQAGLAMHKEWGDEPVLVRDCRVTNNADFGLRNHRNTRVDRCTVTHNGGDHGAGITGGEINISRSRIADNYIGIDVAWLADLVFCQVVDNEDIGVTAKGISAGQIIRTQLRGNRMGLRIGGDNTHPIWYVGKGNDLHDNRDADLMSIGPGRVRADDCYWGETTTRELAAGQTNLTRIIDSHDDGPYTEVIIRTWADAPQVPDDPRYPFEQELTLPPELRWTMPVD